MVATRQDSDEAERANPNSSRLVFRSDLKHRAITSEPHVVPPSIKRAHGRGVPTRHTLYRRNNVADTHDRKARAAGNILGADLGSENDIVHVDEVLTQRLNIYASPVGGWVRFQFRDGLLDYPERRLSLCNRRYTVGMIAMREAVASVNIFYLGVSLPKEQDRACQRNCCPT